MLKHLVHYLSSRSLEKHRLNTQCKIEEYEREAAASQARVQTQADAYKHEIQKLARLREEQLKSYVQLLNDHIEKTTQYIAHLKELPEAMFLCVDAWLRKNISEQRLKLEQGKAQIIYSTISYVDELAAQLVKLSAKEDRHAWQALIADRPPRVMTPEISRHTKAFLREAQADAKAYEKDLHRIRSYKIQLRKQQNELKKQIAQLKADATKVRDQHRQVKQRMQDIHRACITEFNGLQEVFEHVYRYEQSESPLANHWISLMTEGGTLKEINQVLSETRDDFEQAKREKSDLYDRNKHLRGRIQWAHDNKDYSTIEADKKSRALVVAAIPDAREQVDKLHVARQVFFTRREEIKKLMSWINEFHPSKTIEQVFNLLMRDGDDIYWPAIGLATKTLRPSGGRTR